MNCQSKSVQRVRLKKNARSVGTMKMTMKMIPAGT